MDECGWTPVAPATDGWARTMGSADSWRLMPRALMRPEGEFLELDDCGRLLFEDA